LHIQLDTPLLLPAGEDCLRCLERLREGVGRLKGVDEVSSSTDGDRLTVRYDPALTGAEMIQQEARRIGVELGRRYAHDVLELRGLDCADCAETAERVLSKKPGVLWVSVNFAAARMQVEYEPARVSREQIAAELRRLGYSTSISAAAETPPAEVGHRHTTELYIPEMDCDEEIGLIRAHLGPLEGVEDLSFNLVAKKLTVIHRLDNDALVQSLREIRMTPYLGGLPRSSPASFWQEQQRLIFTAASALFISLGFLLSLLGSPRAVTVLLYVLAMAAGGWLVARRAFFAVRALTLDINVLMCLAVIGAAAIGDWLEGAMVIFLFALANLLESRSMERARRSIKALMDLSPPTARVLRGQQEFELGVAEVRVGEVLAVRPGERIPLDGVVCEGSSAVDQSPITGESLPVEKGPGAEVFGGTINGRGYLEVRVTRPSTDTTLARIIHAVEEAQSRKAPSQSFVDRFARYYTPAVVLAALLVAVLPPLIGGQAWGTWFYRALVFLVVACPCALVISTPVTIVSGLARATRDGVLIKGGVYLESLGRIPVFAFDKTGTLTAGRPEVSEVLGLNGSPQEEVLRAAAAVESRSEHPLAGAILEHARRQGLEPPEAREFQALPGRGAAALIDGTLYYVGNHRLFEELGWCSAEVDERLERLESLGQTVVLVGGGGRLTGLLTVADQPRAEARGAMEGLKASGVRTTVMLTGDNLATARAIAERLGIDEYRAELLPEDKVRVVRELAGRHRGVAMVGDGVNDAPALAAATVGIAMGAAGTDAALETADVALMADDLSRLPGLVGLSRRVAGIIRQNIGFALLIKTLFLALTPFGLTSLWLAVLADMGASLLVIFNGLRALNRARTR
jgi:Cd2+/Zn2+-exporting ATPase